MYNMAENITIHTIMCENTILYVQIRPKVLGTNS